MTKRLFLILFVFGIVSCVTQPKLIDSNKTVEAIEQHAITSAKLDSLVDLTKIEKRVVEKTDNKITYGFTLLNELEVAIASEKQAAFNSGYEAGKKDALTALKKDYVSLEDVKNLLRENGLLKD